MTVQIPHSCLLQTKKAESLQILITDGINPDVMQADRKAVGALHSGKYITRYVVDLQAETVITEIRIYADENGKINIPLPVGGSCL